jgi:cation diffusion facilitator family transporter
MGVFSMTEEGTTRLSITVNILLFVLKLIGGFVGGSRALLADALNSLLDIVANSVVWIGILVAKRPPDKHHHYGHGHANTLAALFVATLLVVTGIYIGVSAIHVIIDRDYSSPGALATAVAAFTIIVKEILYRITLRAGLKANSPAVIANAYDHRADVYASAGALVGIVVAQSGYPILDPIAGLFIGLLILKNAVSLMRDNLHFLMGGAPDDETLKQILETTQRNEGVQHVWDIRVRSVGTKYVADLKIMVNGALSVTEGHEIATRIRRDLLAGVKNMQDAVIHVEPYEQVRRKEEQ